MGTTDAAPTLAGRLAPETMVNVLRTHPLVILVAAPAEVLASMRPAERRLE